MDSFEISVSSPTANIEIALCVAGPTKEFGDMFPISGFPRVLNLNEISRMHFYENQL